MSFGIGESNSTVKQNTYNVDNSMQASGSATVIRDQSTRITRTKDSHNITLGDGSSYSVNVQSQGLTADQLGTLINLKGATGTSNPAAENDIGSAVQTALDTTAEGKAADTAQKGKINVWLLAVFGTVIVFGAIKLFRKR